MRKSVQVTDFLVLAPHELPFNTISSCGYYLLKKRFMPIVQLNNDSNSGIETVMKQVSLIHFICQYLLTAYNIESIFL